jgi:hypothetical protein
MAGVIDTSGTIMSHSLGSCIIGDISQITISLVGRDISVVTMGSVMSVIKSDISPPISILISSDSLTFSIIIGSSICANASGLTSLRSPSNPQLEPPPPAQLPCSFLLPDQDHPIVPSLFPDPIPVFLPADASKGTNSSRSSTVILNGVGSSGFASAVHITLSKSPIKEKKRNKYKGNIP